MTRSHPSRWRTTSSPRRVAPCGPSCSSNDLIADGDEVQFERFDKLNDADVLKDFKRQSDNTFRVVAPDEGAGAKVLTYGITDGLFDAVSLDPDRAGSEELQQPADRCRRHRRGQAG